MSAGEEQQIIKQYQPLIRALIPYEQDNRLLEGINKFSKRLPGNVRKIIKEEVVRLTSLTDASADNSAFAKFPVMKFKHFGIPMRLDKVGAKILQNETALYQVACMRINYSKNTKNLLLMDIAEGIISSTN